MSQKLKVVLCGCLPSQFNQLERQCKNVKLIFTDKDKSVKIPNGDFYIVWTRFCSHSKQIEVINASDGSNVLLHRGGITALREYLQKL